MTTLADILLAPGRREAVIGRTAEWIERYVAERAGLRGLTLKAGLAALKAARHDALPRGVAVMLPEFARALEPVYQAFRASKERDFSRYLAQHSEDATQALMAVTDARAAATSYRTLASGYRRMRGTIEHELHTLVPEIAKMLRGLVAPAEPGAPSGDLPGR
jgi:hypothetical protein